MDISRVKRHQTKIDEYMDKQGISTDKELAEKMNLTQQKLSFRLNGKISMDTMERLAAYFNTTVKELLR